MYKEGYRFAVVEAQLGTDYNSNAKYIVQRAHAAGIRAVDLYMFPHTELNPKTWMHTALSKFKADGILTTNMIWLDGK